MSGKVTAMSMSESMSEHKLPAFHEALLDSLTVLPDAAFLVGQDGCILHVNELAEAMFGYSVNELVGQKIECCLPNRLVDLHTTLRETYFDDPTLRPMGAGIEQLGRHKDGTEFPAEISLSPMQSPTGPIVLASVRDITDRIAIRKRLQKTHDTLVATQREMSLAKKVQQGLLPSAAPAVPGFDIAGVSLPADETGGDYFSHRLLRDGRLALAVGDVTGHGISAALLAAVLHAYLRALSTSETAHLGEVMVPLNQLLSEDVSPDRFVTLFLGELDWHNKTLSHASAGHTTGYVLDAAGLVKAKLLCTAPPLGVIDLPDFNDVLGPVQLESGDIVAIFTDGVTEAMDVDDEMFGYDRALEVIRTHADLDAQGIADALIREVLDFGPDAHEDDVTVAILKTL